MVKVVLFGEIEVNPSDIKHVTELVGRSDGLGMVVTAGAYSLGLGTHRWVMI